MTHKAVGGGGHRVRGLLIRVSFSYDNSKNITLELHLLRISWFSDTNARHEHPSLLLLSGPAREDRQKQFEQERLSSFTDYMEYFIE